MRTLAFASVLSAFAVIGLLPALIFRQGRLNAMWWATALPFVLCVLATGLVFAGSLRALGAPAFLRPLAIAASAGSVALMAWAARAHPGPVAKWHQPGIVPTSLVTAGPYRWVRHPFYASFQLTFAAACLAFPHPAVFATALVGAGMLHLTAHLEERSLLASPLGEPYARYRRRAGRFLPRWSA